MRCVFCNFDPNLLHLYTVFHNSKTKQWVSLTLHRPLVQLIFWMVSKLQVQWSNLGWSHIDSGNFSIHIFSADNLFFVCCLFLWLCMSVVGTFHTSVNSNATWFSDNAWFGSETWAECAIVHVWPWRRNVISCPLCPTCWIC